ncbi:hypothetical protein RCG23_25120 [Neobacillus sp. PS3-34]|nr:hypothetical protein [Neobacillus sp. PS3-34]WML48470.1 hypothetical protein RCG23_25120 [Neobacillus sp. PS3-34]
MEITFIYLMIGILISAPLYAVADFGLGMFFLYCALPGYLYYSLEG